MPRTLGHGSAVHDVAPRSPAIRRGLVLALVLSLPSLAACGYRPPYRYTNNLEVDQSAQRASVGGVLRYDCLWRQAGIPNAVVELWVGDDEAPLASATTGHDGEFLLTSGYLLDPGREGRVRITYGAVTDQEPLPGPLDENYRLDWLVACPEDRPDWLASDDETVAFVPAGASEEDGRGQARHRRISWARGTDFEFNRRDDRFTAESHSPPR